MTDWFARPVLNVKDVEASLRFYLNQLGFTSPWRYDEDGRALVAQVDRLSCALILTDMWPEKIGTRLMFISLNAEPETQVAALDALRAELGVRVVPVTMVRGDTGFWWSTISTAISRCSTIRARPHPTKLSEIKRNHAAPSSRAMSRSEDDAIRQDVRTVGPRLNCCPMGQSAHPDRASRNSESRSGRGQTGSDMV
jgi:hypothetical protein